MSSKSKANSLYAFRSLNNSYQSNGKLSGISAVSSMTSFRSSILSRTSSLSGRSSLSGVEHTECPPPTLSKLQASSNVSVGSTTSELMDTLTSRPKENVTVTVRFRPLSSREIQRGDKLAWYADGDTLVRSTLCSATAYAFDRVFGPATSTRHVYEVAAQHIVKGAMEGVNGTVFAYGVTSSGKTHTMHGDQSAHGIIPLAIQNVFSIIQETPGREFLLRVSYLEIYNEVINDLLNPTGQNLRIRADTQGAYVEGLKEEVVLSPDHCLSLIATGEEHRHVGSNNFNLLSSRSHTIFTLTIESSPGEGDFHNEEVTLSQLNLIDLAGSESSKTETTGLRRKEGSYINKSLLTLGTVISKLTDAKATHIPYRDSKLTRLLQSSLRGHGRISLICTVTPATSTNEETHNTLKFAHRAKQVEIHAHPNKIVDEKSLIKKYQKEIQHLKHELEQLKRRMMDISELKEENQEDFTNLKQQMEAGQLKLQTRLEEEEQAKAALLERIERLTRLILVSTKNTAAQTLLEKLAHRRRHSFSEEKLAFSPVRRCAFMSEEENGYESEISADLKASNIMGDYFFKEGIKLKRHSMLAWYKYGEADHGVSVLSIDSDSSSIESSVASGCQVDTDYDLKGRCNPANKKVEDASSSDCLDSPQSCDILSVTNQGRRPLFTGSTVADQMDLLREQVKMLAGEVTLCTSSLRRLSEQAVIKSDDDQVQKKGADSKVLKEKLQSKAAESKEIQTVIASLREQRAAGKENSTQLQAPPSLNLREGIDYMLIGRNVFETSGYTDNAQIEDAITARQVIGNESSELQLQLLKKKLEIEKLQFESDQLREERDQLREERDAIQVQSLRVAEEASFARELASAAAHELKNLAQEVEKLSFQNNQLAAELASVRELAYARAGSDSGVDEFFLPSSATGRSNKYRMGMEKAEKRFSNDTKKELLVIQEREASLEALLAEKELNEVEAWRRTEKAKRKGTDLENELTETWVLVSSIRKCTNSDDSIPPSLSEDRKSMEDIGDGYTLGTGWSGLEECRKEAEHPNAELQTLVSQFKSEDLEELDLASLEDLYALHVDALNRLDQAKARVRKTLDKNRSGCSSVEDTILCRVCLSEPLSALLLPCCHASLCRLCAATCTDCPLCKRPIEDK